MPLVTKEKEMILKRFMTFAALIALVFIPLFSSPVDAQTYFSDDFEDRDDRTENG